MAIAFDAATKFGDSGSSSYSFSHTVTASGSNRYLIVGIATSVSFVDSVTYAGDSMTQLATVTDYGGAGTRDVDYWYLLSPSTGSNTVSITLGGSAQIAAAAISYTGVDQNNPHGTHVTKDNDGVGSPSIDLTSQAGELCVDVIGSEDNPTAGAGQTHRVDSAGSGVTPNLDASEEGGAQTVTMSWGSSVDDSGHIAVPLRPASGGRQLRTRYHVNTGVNRMAGRTVILDTLGRDVPMEQIKTDEWTHMGGAFFPTTRRFQNLIADRSRGYNESVSSRDTNTSNARARIAVRKESQLDFILRRLTRGSV